jgi:hypothetical protein
MIPIEDMEALLGGHEVQQYQAEPFDYSMGEELISNCFFMGGVDFSKTEHNAEYIGSVGVSCGTTAYIDAQWKGTGALLKPLPGAPKAARSNGTVAFMKVTPQRAHLQHRAQCHEAQRAR